ncbi:MAG TPA: hypothetical protein VN285_04650 [Candidatus Deferrimicrobium sp.]|nr:hypothetical protein [Candidatus Deferrimicrobium sp.]
MIEGVSFVRRVPHGVPLEAGRNKKPDNRLARARRDAAGLAFAALTALILFATAENCLAQTDITVPPLDSAEAARVRIWVPVSHQNGCRMTITILNDSGRVVRHLLDRLVSAGFFNYYWDKKDDTGGFVQAGEYTYLVDDCGTKRQGIVTAQFREWERDSRVQLLSQYGTVKVELELFRDSALVSLDVYNRRGNRVAGPIADSLMLHGRHELEWRPPKSALRGRYLLKLTVGDFAHTIEVNYRP